MLNRRKLITGLISFVAAPAIVKVNNLMPIKVMEPWRLPLPWVDMTGIENYVPTEHFALDISYGLHDGTKFKWITYEEALEHWPLND